MLFASRAGLSASGRARPHPVTQQKHKPRGRSYAGQLFAAATLAAARRPGLAAAKPLTVCTESSPDGFDVVQYNSLVTTNASADVIFNTLVSYDETAKKVVPALADKWDASADGLTYTFHLRPNVAFQTTDYFADPRARRGRRRVHVLADARRFEIRGTRWPARAASRTRSRWAS